MKRLALPALLALVACCGCNTITFTRISGTNTVSVSVSRFLWATESYEASLDGNSAKLKAMKSTADSAALGAVAEGAARGAAAGVK